MINFKKLLLIFPVMLLLAGCSLSQAGNAFIEEDKIHVVTTVGMIKDMIDNIGGDKVEVKSMMGEGVDPHSYQATAGDLTAIKQADVTFYVGLHLEGKMVDFLEALSKDGRGVGVSDDLDRSRLRGTEAGYDPHIWFDVDLWSGTVVSVLDKLLELDPANAEFYRENYEKYMEKLEDLDEFVRDEIAQIPEEKRIMVTAHDAFGYFGDAYGITVKAIQGLNTMQEYGVKDLELLADYIYEHEVPLMFMETSISDRSIKALMQGVLSRGGKVEIGGELFSDAMGADGTFEGTYEGMLKHNVKELVKLKEYE